MRRTPLPDPLFLHELDALLALCSEADQDSDHDTPPHCIVTPGCSHPTVTTTVVEAAQRVLSVVCVTCEAQVAIAVEEGSQVHDPGPHSDERVVLYSAGRLAVCCADCTEALSLWDVTPYVLEAP
jgi:hypothetical protein